MMSSELGGALYGLESEAGQDQKIEVDQEGNRRALCD